MFLLYADESGTPGGAEQEHFVLAGITVFERKSHWLSLELDKIAARFNNQDPNSVELHGAPMLSGRKFWRKFDKEDRLNAIKDALRLIDGKYYRVIASVVKKGAISPQDRVYSTFQQLITRFDHFLAREHTHFKNPQRGLILFDKSSKEAPIQALATEFKIDGHEWGKLRNMADVPVFIDSYATRLIQLADLVAYAIFRKYEKQDNQFFEMIENKFDYFGGVQHGLHVSV
ncbi:DUF3800 domain-containing protein [Marinomonas lutimaris]|uniref:DUF3800 domain-containing protein n=1 Tax=Marinomonas lutimaris TaxID=2846746 RepID=UPI001C67EBB8|nr:DUF3800 domain-containing protein [Marinomonas lutimaris]